MRQNAGLMPQELFGYPVVKQIGEGAASTVYVVRDPKSNSLYTLKHVVRKSERDDRFLEQVEAEYALGSKLQHQNVRGTVRLERKRKLFRTVELGLVLEFVDGRTLEEHPPTAVLAAVRIFAQVAIGLASMHAKGVVHADMKPNNVMLTAKTGIVKIIDLGQACAIGTVKKRIQGTPGFIAPEQAAREEITPLTDVYNFGATMYWALLGDLIPTAMPPKDDTQTKLYRGALDGKSIRLPVPPHERRTDIPAILSKTILDCVQPDPAKRVQLMAHLAGRLALIGDLIENPTTGMGPESDSVTNA